MSEVFPEHGVLPLSSLRLLVPPLQLVSAALWGIVQQRAVMHYGLLEDFVTTVMENIPELLTFSERVQLVLGLRAKVVLEMCRSNDFCSRQTIETHLKRIDTYIIEKDEKATTSKVKASVGNFLKLVHILLDDPCQRDAFYQETFPAVFGPKYDSALQALVRKFLLSFQKLLPVPSLEQTSLWLSLSPSILKECVDIVQLPEPLNKLIQHHKHGHKVPQDDDVDDCILSSLSSQPPDTDTDKVTGDVFESKTTQYEHESRDVHSDAEQDGQREVEDVTDDYGPSVEVTLPFDDTDSHDYDTDIKELYQRQTESRASPKTFKCLVCGQNFGSFGKLKRHGVIGCSPELGGQNKIIKVNLYSKSMINTGKYAWKRENKHLSIAADAVSNQDHLPSLENFPDDNTLSCSVCGQVFKYLKNLVKHQKVCVDRSKQQRQPDLKRSTPSSHQSEPQPSDNTTESLYGELKGGPSETPQQLMCSQPEKQMCKRSSRIKTCSICGQVFTSSTDVTRHMKSHTEESPYICGDCGKVFDNYEDYRTHQEDTCIISNKHPEDVEFTQEMSSRQIDNKKKTLVPKRTIRHTTVSDKPMSSQQACKLMFTCDECGQRFKYSRSFEKHKSKCLKNNPQTHEGEITNHSVIDACNLESLVNTNDSKTGSEQMEKNETSAESENTPQIKHCTMKCTLCNKTFSEFVLLKKHYSVSHNVRGPYQCPLCERRFVRLCELVKHHQNKKLFQCATCKKCFTEPSWLSDHQKVHSTSTTPHICETCGKSCKSVASLILHKKMHRNDESTICSYCGKQFSSKECLKRHVVRHTGGYPCPVCGKMFFRQIYLKWHMYKHTGKEPYLCETCGKGWPNAAYLKIHMIEHTQERPFKCEECGVSFKRKSDLQAHCRAKHMKLRPFVCDVCTKAFRLNSELKKHMMVHTGDRPFACPRCDKTFTRKSRLREHREKACL